MNKILFVDDEPKVISGLKRQLIKLLPNSTLLGANSGKETINIIEKTIVDVIVLDICMPEMDGIELLNLLKTNPKTKFVPVIMLTGRDEIELRRKALDLGAFDFVSKPADMLELVARIKGALRIKPYEDQSTLDQIFNPFFTTKEKGKGTGIGLSIVNRIVKLFNGFISVESTVGVGIKFLVYLPAPQTTSMEGKQREREESIG